MNATRRTISMRKALKVLPVLQALPALLVLPGMAALGVTHAVAGEEETTPVITHEKFIEAVEAGKISLILDVRSAEEYAEGHVAGAVNVPHDAVAEHVETLDPHKSSTVVVYCHSGRRAGMAEDQLRAMGFTDLLHLDGDMKGWLEAEQPVEQSAPSGP